MKFKDMPYERVDFTEVERELKALMEESKAAASGEEQFAVHEKYYRLTDRVNTMMTIAHIRYSINTADEFYDGERKYYDEQGPIYQNLLLQYEDILYNSPYRPYLEQKIGPVAFKNMKLSKKAFNEKVITLSQEENALTAEYNKLIAGAKIEFDGKVCNLSMLTPYTTGQDREVRKAAWAKMDEFFVANADKLDEIYDKLVKNRTAQARVMGYEDYCELGYYRMWRNSYTKEDVESFRNQVKRDLVPLAERIHDNRRKRLGLDKLSCVDNSVWFVNGNPKPIGTPEEIMASGQQMYSELSPETKEFFGFMMENELFDVLGRQNKQAGGYMTYLPLYQSPFIFANFNGTSGDVDVVTHECGHAFQGYISGKDPIREHADITMETAEIHSMSMEFFAERWMPLFFGDRADEYVQMHLEDAIAFIPYGCMVDEFQHIVYANPDLTPAERRAAWSKLEKEYKPHLDYTGYPFFENGGYWQRQQHIFNSPFYYIDYCLAQTCALEFKVKMEEDYESAWADYLKLCKLSASDFFTGLLAQVGLDNPFEDGCLKKLVAKLPVK
ncbi:MAG: M3 family oligoendopeptidase [Lachnospiraceae bacterium]|nr:M3 family oligoendopeptidase [Lachnospiraceae bacterium]